MLSLYYSAKNYTVFKKVNSKLFHNSEKTQNEIIPKLHFKSSVVIRIIGLHLKILTFAYFPYSVKDESLKYNH